MTPQAVKRIVAEEIEKHEPFENFHGITNENVYSFLVEPCEVTVDPDDGESKARSMWVIIDHDAGTKSRQVVVFDSQESYWGIAEHVSGSNFILIIAASSLAEALNGM